MERKKSTVINDAIYYLSRADEVDSTLVDELFDLYYMLRKMEEEDAQ